MLRFNPITRLGKKTVLPKTTLWLIMVSLIICLLCDSLPAAQNLPPNIRAAQEALTKPSDNSTYILSLVLLLIVVLVTWRAIVFRRNHKMPYLPPVNDPQKLFDELLGQLKLEPADQKLLRQMVRGARLKHPTMCLLSPQMLAWACKLWHTEKNLNEVPSDIAQQLDRISYQLFDQHTNLIEPTDKQGVSQIIPDLIELEPEIENEPKIEIELETELKTEQNQKPLMVQPVLEEIF